MKTQKMGIKICFAIGYTFFDDVVCQSNFT